jgi:hypothetical protein
VDGVASKTILSKVHGISRISRLDVYGRPGEKLQRVLTSFIHTPITYLLGSVGDGIL